METPFSVRCEIRQTAAGVLVVVHINECAFALDGSNVVVDVNGLKSIPSPALGLLFLINNKITALAKADILTIATTTEQCRVCVQRWMNSCPEVVQGQMRVAFPDRS